VRDALSDEVFTVIGEQEQEQLADREDKDEGDIKQVKVSRQVSIPVG
jgi:hypothetical protein